MLKIGYSAVYKTKWNIKFIVSSQLVRRNKPALMKTEPIKNMGR